MIPRPQSHSKALGPGVTGPELLVPTSAPLERPPAATPLAPSCGAHAFMVDPTAVPAVNPAADPSRQHTKYPYVTGTSVLGVKYRDGVLIAADMLGAYGSTKRYKSMQRVVKVRANSGAHGYAGKGRPDSFSRDLWHAVCLLLRESSFDMISSPGQQVMWWHQSITARWA